MARKARIEMAGGVYHVINRGNYRSDIFRGEKTRAAFLKCLDETCRKTGWRVHAWCIMSNHYHLAIETPSPNLIEGMRWLQSTFSMRFNRLRKVHGHLFQGRYKSLIVEGAGLGALCHYIHLNPVRAKVCSLQELVRWPWSSFLWLNHPNKRLGWYQSNAALDHAGGLADTSSGRAGYLQYLAWLNEDDLARQQLQFEKMSKGWAIGSKDFKKGLAEESKEAAKQTDRHEGEAAEIKNSILNETLDRLLKQLGRRKEELPTGSKSVDWKVALGAAMKLQTTATNAWLSKSLYLGHPDEVSRKITQWLRRPDPQLTRKLTITLSTRA